MFVNTVNYGYIDSYRKILTIRNYEESSINNLLLIFERLPMQQKTFSIDI